MTERLLLLLSERHNRSDSHCAHKHGQTLRYNRKSRKRYAMNFWNINFKKSTLMMNHLFQISFPVACTPLCWRTSAWATESGRRWRGPRRSTYGCTQRSWTTGEGVRSCVELKLIWLVQKSKLSEFPAHSLCWVEINGEGRNRVVHH